MGFGAVGVHFGFAAFVRQVCQSLYNLGWPKVSAPLVGLAFPDGNRGLLVALLIKVVCDRWRLLTELDSFSADKEGFHGSFSLKTSVSVMGWRIGSGIFLALQGIP